VVVGHLWKIFFLFLMDAPPGVFIMFRLFQSVVVTSVISFRTHFFLWRDAAPVVTTWTWWLAVSPPPPSTRAIFSCHHHHLAKNGKCLSLAILSAGDGL